MNKNTLVSYGRIFFGILVIVAIITQLADGLQQERDIINFFSFFTIQSNILAALILITVGIGALAKKKGSPQFAFLRGAATLYMIMTGIIFALFLSGLQQALQTTIPWVNTVLHYIMPVVMLLDWLLYPPAQRVPFKKALWWLAYPLAYLVYSWGRGAFTHWYPYPFLNPDVNGWPIVLGTCAFIGVIITGIVKLLTRRRKA
ncbi:Pr6Pr family membrane protein [Streptomyces caniscabiei]|uniref:Pr6Pr family membrane protein n=1 Tax=Streptomyces caniscabiei TaxID=2746961 RepID=UPI0029AFAFDC|nr:Pr6Pr family membrane protein [Streptomyces caniscabiei]MDX2776072.1 Pr6Pr family membrane protein [Streptomyces caniscabiei]